MADHLVNSLTNEYDYIQSFCSSWNVVSMDISKDENDFRHLKSRIKLFIEEYPKLVIEIKDYFSDELIEYVLKRLFRFQFSIVDSAHTNNLFQRFFLEQDENIRIILNYFVDDIRPLLLTSKFQSLPWSIRQFVLFSPKSILISIIINWLNLKGSNSLTSILFTNLINSNQNVNQQQTFISFYQTNIYLFLIIHLLILIIAINISPIAILINYSIFIFLICFILYYTLSHYCRFN